MITSKQELAEQKGQHWGERKPTPTKKRCYAGSFLCFYALKFVYVGFLFLLLFLLWENNVTGRNVASHSGVYNKVFESVRQMATPAPSCPNCLRHRVCGMRGTGMNPIANPFGYKMAAPTTRVLVQYVVVRSDLLTELQWPIGAVIAQACHASSAVVHLFRDDPNTVAYTENLDSMHKVVLAADTEAKLRSLSAKLTESKVDHKMWIEMPENIPTCIATKPYPRDEIQVYFKKFKLFK